VQYRSLGRTDLKVSEISFGCGSVGALMTRDRHEEQLKAVRRALDLGINHFDTAVAYGDGASEANLGKVLEETEAKATLSTKVLLGPEALGSLKKATIASVGKSLERLRRKSVDVIQLHNHLAPGREWPGFALSPEDVLGPGGVLEGFKALREDGKVRYFGFTGLGSPQALHALVESGEFHTVQAYYNLLNPSAGHPVPKGFSALDYGPLLEKCAAHGVGVFVIRVLARGALAAGSGAGGGNPRPLSPGSDYPGDVERARKLEWLVGGDVKTLSQAAIRFALMKPEVSTVLVGFSNVEQVEEAVSCSGAGRLPERAMARLRKIWDSGFQDAPR